MYYPLSQIKTNLYTNGEEYAIASTNQPYKGYYYKTSTGQYFTGKTPQDLPNELLQPIITPTTLPAPEIQSAPIINLDLEDVKNFSYISLTNTNVNKVTYIPFYSPQLPTQQDYQVGEFKRYFCKKTNETIYIEINKDQYDKLVSKNSQILWQLYLPFFIDWQLTGDKQQVAKTNRNMVLLKSKNLKLPAFSLYLKEDYTKYYQ
jgi:sensor histidine kinase YesM